jgi:hypothetical protein
MAALRSSTTMPTLSIRKRPRSPILKVLTERWGSAVAYDQSTMG